MTSASWSRSPYCAPHSLERLKCCIKTLTPLPHTLQVSSIPCSNNSNLFETLHCGDILTSETPAGGVLLSDKLPVLVLTSCPARQEELLLRCILRLTKPLPHTLQIILGFPCFAAGELEELIGGGEFLTSFDLGFLTGSTDTSTGGFLLWGESPTTNVFGSFAWLVENFGGLLDPRTSLTGPWLPLTCAELVDFMTGVLKVTELWDTDNLEVLTWPGAGLTAATTFSHL